MKYLLLITALALSACNTLSRKECENMNWNEKGRTAALNGDTSVEALAYYGKECGEKWGLRPDDTKFRAGWMDGAKTYCTKESAATVGSKGGIYKGICSAESEGEFLKAYNPAYTTFAQKRIVELEHEVARWQSAAASAEGRASSAEARASSAEGAAASATMSCPVCPVCAP